jgi:hypothetical protein
MNIFSLSFTQRNGGYYSTGKGTPANIENIAKQFNISVGSLKEAVDGYKSSRKQHLSPEEIKEIAKQLLGNTIGDEFEPISESTHRRKK